MTRTFRTSTHSSYNGNCVEIAFSKPRRSAGNGACRCGLAHIRDSKDQAGPVLTYGAPAWRRFTAAVKAGKYDLP